MAECLAAGDDVNMQDQQGNTALHWSCLLGLHGLTSLLLAHDARTDIPNQNGSYAVHAAVAGKNIKALQMLTSDKSTHTSKEVLLLQDNKGYSPFLVAAENNDVYTMEWLYLQGIGVDQRGFKGETAVQLTSRLSHTPALQWLIFHKASVLERDNAGRTAFHHACAHGCHEAIKMLIDSVESRKSLDCKDLLGDRGMSLAWQHGQWSIVAWLMFVECLEAWTEALSARWLLQFAMSRSAWTTIFWTLLTVNFVTFNLTMLTSARGTQAMLWLALLVCVVLVWVQLASSDPGFTGSRFTQKIQEEDLDLETMTAILGLTTVDKQVEHFEKMCGKAHDQGATSGHPTDGVELSPVARLDQTSLTLDDTVAPTIASRCAGLPPASSRSSRTMRCSEFLLEDEEHAWDQEAVSNSLLRCPDSVILGRRWLRLSRRQQLCRHLMEKLEPQELAKPRYRGHRAEEGTIRKQVLQWREFQDTLKTKAMKLMEEAGAMRFKEISEQSGEYAVLANDGEFRTLCTICRRVRDMRAFHCKLCGSCVQRMDHHCPWVDRCIGLENQRSFYVFLILLAAVFLLFFHISIYCLTKVEMNGASIAVLLVLLCDMPAMMFVLALILRQTVYMLVNVTTYEVLVCPPHMSNRFPRRSSSLWYLHGCSLRGCLRNFISYWMMDMSADYLDFEDMSCGEDPFTEECSLSFKCCQWSSGYLHQHNEAENFEEWEPGLSQKLNSRTVVLPHRLSL